MHFSITVGAFIPKPHTPYQWAAQIDAKTARAKIDFIRNSLKTRGHKVSYNDPFIAVIEGLLSRGDGRVGELVSEAYAQGCRLDAWDEHIKKDAWAALLEAHAPLVQELGREREIEAPLPWDCVNSGTSKNFLKREYEKSKLEEFTSTCTDNCNNPCGNCNEKIKIVSNTIHDDNTLYEQPPMSAPPATVAQDPLTLRVLFSFEKQGTAVFLPHLALIEVFSMAFLRAGIPVLFNQGFNPIPKLDFASPLALGIAASGEIACVDLALGEGAALEPESFIRDMNKKLPGGIAINEAIKVKIPTGEKKHSIPSLLWGSVYRALDGSEDYVPFADEKNYRAARINSGGTVFSLARKTVLAKKPGDKDPAQYDSYFNVYRSLYPD
jgi:hypothetical protein